MECVAYMRVSTEKQAEEGNGLESQRRDIENYARKNELIIKDWYIDDGYTGANMNRPQLQRLINDCMRHRVKCVVAFKLDRISRNMIDALSIIERIFMPNGTDFKCVHDNVGYSNPAQQTYTQMLAVFSNYEKNTIIMRMRGGMLERVKQGYWRGGGNLPYCYSYNKEHGILIPIPERAKQANKAIQLFIDGYSDEKIAAMLGYTSELVVRNILTGVVNIGMIKYKGEIYQGRHEPIFDKDIFEKAQEFRKVRRNAREYRQSPPKLLTGLCYCGICGCKMRYQKWFDGDDRIYCYSRNHFYIRKLPNWNPDCTNAIVKAKDIESKVESKILQISCDLSKAKKQERESKYDIIKANIEKERNKLKRLYNLYADGNDTVIEMIKSQESSIKTMEEEAIQVYNEESNMPKKDFVFESIKKLDDVWDKIDRTQKNRLLKTIIHKVVITNGNVDIYLNF